MVCVHFVRHFFRGLPDSFISGHGAWLLHVPWSQRFTRLITAEQIQRLETTMLCCFANLTCKVIRIEGRSM